MRITLTPCFILHSRPYRETSSLLDIFSREHGRITLVARGVRRDRKKSAALYQSYRNLNISWSGRGEMGTLTAIEPADSGYSFSGSSLISAFYLNELLMRLLHRHESHPELFDAYVKALTRLAHGESEMLALRYFEKHLLDSIGYGLVLDHDTDSGTAISSEQHYFYVINEGPCINKPAGRKFIEISGSTLQALDKESFDDKASTGEARNLMRLTLDTYLGEKPLASRDLFRAYNQQRQKRVV